MNLFLLSLRLLSLYHFTANNTKSITNTKLSVPITPPTISAKMEKKYIKLKRVKKFGPFSNNLYRFSVKIKMS
jgi:hypothetical protein